MMKNRVSKKAKSTEPARHPTKLDPSRTLALRKAFAADLKRRFTKVKLKLWQLVVDQDAFGLGKPRHPLVGIPLQVGNEVSKYASVQLNLPDEQLVEELNGLRAQLDPADVLEMEVRPHVTVRYGLLYNDATPVKKLLVGTGPVQVKLGRLSLFQNPEEDVLKLEVDSGGLRSLSSLLGRLPNLQTHKEYNPHLTLAYLKPGTGGKYVNLFNPVFGWTFFSSTLTFSDSERNAEEITINLLVDNEGDFDVDKHPKDAKGRFARVVSGSAGAVSGAYKGTKTLVGKVEHAVQIKVVAWVDKLPAVLRGPLKLAFKAFMASYSMSWALASQVAKERGMTDEQAKKLCSTLATVDCIAAKGAAVVGGAVGSMIPVATAGYLAYSTARNPLATLRAAGKLIKKMMPKQQLRDPYTELEQHKIENKYNFNDDGTVTKVPEAPLTSYNVFRQDADKIADALQRHNWNDWYHALLVSALAETGGNVEEAIRLADVAFEMQKEPPEEKVENTKDAEGHEHDELGRFTSEAGVVSRKADNALMSYRQKAKLMDDLTRDTVSDESGNAADLAKDAATALKHLPEKIANLTAAKRHEEAAASHQQVADLLIGKVAATSSKAKRVGMSKGDIEEEKAKARQVGEIHEEAARLHREAAEAHVVEHIRKQTGEVDWRPTETMPEDYYTNQFLLSGNVDGRILQLKRLLSGFSPDKLDGLYVWVNLDQGKVIIDQMDWNEGDAAKYVGRLAEKLFGEGRVKYQNEGPKPEGNGWVDVVSDLVDNVQVPDIRQQMRWDCGAAACISVGKHFGVGPDTLDGWVELLDADEDSGTRPGRIITCLEDLGLYVQPRHGMTLKMLNKEVEHGRLILCPVQKGGNQHTREDDKEGHWVVVTKVTDDGNVQLQDPASGPRTVEGEVWLRGWHDVSADGTEWVRYGIAVGKGDPAEFKEGVTNAFDPEEKRNDKGKWTKSAKPSPKETRKVLKEYGLKELPGSSLIYSRHLMSGDDDNPTSEDPVNEIVVRKAGKWWHLKNDGSGVTHVANGNNHRDLRKHLDKLIQSKVDELTDREEVDWRPAEMLPEDYHLNQKSAKKEQQEDLDLQPGGRSYLPSYDPTKVDGGWGEDVLNAFNPEQERDEKGRFSKEFATEAEAQSKFNEVGDEVAGKESRYSKQVRIIEPAENRMIQLSMGKEWDDEEGKYTGNYKVRVDFDVRGETSDYSAKTLQPGTKTMADLLKKIVKAYHDVGFKIAFGAATEGRSKLYAKVLTRMGFKKEPDSRGEEIWNLALSSGDRISNADFSFRTDPDKLSEFKKWLEETLGYDVLKPGEDVIDAYIRQGFLKGGGRAFDDAHAVSKAGSSSEEGSLDFWQGSKDQFLKSAFASPASKERVELLVSRAYDDLKGITHAMSVQMGRTLADGLVQGKSPREVARQLNKNVDGIGIKRANTLARTEIIRSHASGQLAGMKSLGISGAEAEVEWTAGSPNMCERCSALADTVFSLDEAEGLIPLHPSCSCCWRPSLVRFLKGK